MENKITIESIYENMSKKLKNYILSSVKDKDAAEDIFQEIFLKAFLKLNTIKDTDKVSSWMFRIVRNTIIDYSRKKQIQSLPGDNIPVEQAAFSNSYNKETNAWAVKSLIETFPENYSKVLIMNIFEEMPVKKIAEILSITESAAKSRLKRARKHLREKLTEYCIFELDKYGLIIDCGINDKARIFLKKRKII